MEENVFEIYIHDLKEDVQEELVEFLGGDNGNYDIYPIVTIVSPEDSDV